MMTRTPRRRAAAPRRNAPPSRVPAGRVDLLTADRAAKMGHALEPRRHWYDPADRDDVMFGHLSTGERRVPALGAGGGGDEGSGRDTANADDRQRFPVAIVIRVSRETVTRRPSVASCSRTRRGLGGYLARRSRTARHRPIPAPPAAAGSLIRRPYDDVEFGDLHIQGWPQLATGAAAGHYDLLTNISRDWSPARPAGCCCPERGVR